MQIQVNKKALIVCAPSGAGKTSIVNYLLAGIPALSFSVSACSRPKRETETEGKDYYFLSADEFRSRIAAGDFVEWEEVYPGRFYGTLKSELERIWKEGRIPCFDVDVKGGISLKNYFGANAFALYIRPPSLRVLEERLRNRGTETEESLGYRLSRIEFEMGFESRFDGTVVNDHLETACKQASEIIMKFLSE